MAKLIHPAKGGSFTVPQGGTGMEKGKAVGTTGGKRNVGALKGILPSHLHSEMNKFGPGK